ncbi:transposase [Streptomyces canus]|uniref:transposase n=1 Tax=Streptomyces canus TaxID=58343 RepID=UPI0036A4CDE3
MLGSECAGRCGRWRWSRCRCGRRKGPNPFNRGKSVSKLHVSSEAQGIPLVVGTSGADTNDSLALKPLLIGIPAVRSRRGPRRKHPAKLRADKAYHSVDILLAVRLPPPHHPVRTKRQPPPRLPRPRRRPDLLQETCRTHHLRYRLIPDGPGFRQRCP